VQVQPTTLSQRRDVCVTLFEAAVFTDACKQRLLSVLLLKGTLPKSRLLPLDFARGRLALLLAMTKAALSWHCEVYEIDRGNLKRLGMVFSNRP